MIVTLMPPHAHAVSSHACTKASSFYTHWRSGLLILLHTSCCSPSASSSSAAPSSPVNSMQSSWSGYEMPSSYACSLGQVRSVHTFVRRIAHAVDSDVRFEADLISLFLDSTRSTTSTSVSFCFCSAGLQLPPQHVLHAPSSRQALAPRLLSRI